MTRGRKIATVVLFTVCVLSFAVSASAATKSYNVTQEETVVSYHNIGNTPETLHVNTRPSSGVATVRIYNQYGTKITEKSFPSYASETDLTTTVQANRIFNVKVLPYIGYSRVSGTLNYSTVR